MKKHLLVIALIAASHSHAATIYLCKAYNGSTFWTSGTCSSRNAFIERIENVADVPFEQQVEQARGNMNRSGSSATTNAQAAGTDQYCGRLINELNEIEGRYSKGYWQPVETVNQDQKRTIAIRSQLRANNCRLQ
ncbi:hypothetical protein D3C87_1444960 [compost metagenome]|uniref:DUF4124 domain-containing protein n=1 Tax=Variovorax boronicumulans TaxID=436515 RepID=A0A250DM01_9BURK|nr:hypothetical protein [Variovorax boronicumulans]ATA55161.1 hypothetical protein CKY39_19560 [Variovorax boronicumulans]